MNNIDLVLLLLILLLIVQNVNEKYVPENRDYIYAGSLDDLYNDSNPDLTGRTASYFKRCSPESWPDCKNYDKTGSLRVPGRGPFPYEFKHV